MVSRTLDGRLIDKLSPSELRFELRRMILEAARLEKGAQCFHEDSRSVEYTGIDGETVRMYTCRSCKISWRG